jgi:hypothetical protein
LSEVVAQQSAISRIENSIVRSGLAGSSWWLSGATGTGKTTIARILAEEFTQTDFTIVELVGRDVLVDDIREYERRMAYSPMGKGRCLIINEAQDLSDVAVSLLLALVEKVNASKYDMVVFTAMVDVLELKNDPMNRWRALIGRCNHVELADTTNPVFRQDVVEYLEGVAASEGILGVDIRTLCEKAGWSIRAALNALDMQERGVVPVAMEESDVWTEEMFPGLQAKVEPVVAMGIAVKPVSDEAMIGAMAKPKKKPKRVALESEFVPMVTELDIAIDELVATATKRSIGTISNLACLLYDVHPELRRVSKRADRACVALHKPKK